MPNASLAVIFNHRYEQNLPKLRALYASRFPHLSFIVPFAHAKDADVIPVYESSYRFQSYIAQAWPTLERQEADFFAFTGDDCILNPVLDAANLATNLGLDEDTAYTVEMISLRQQPLSWARFPRILSEAQPPETYFAWKRELPEYDEAARRFERHGLHAGELRFEERLPDPSRFGYLKDLRRFRRLQAAGATKPAYPIASGYSDLVVVPRKHMAEFVHYCRVFTGMGYFVEIAIPTALALACPRVKTQETSDWKCSVAWGPEAIQALTEPMGKSMKRLASTYAPQELAKHPVKLSAFENDLPPNDLP